MVRWRGDVNGSAIVGGGDPRGDGVHPFFVLAVGLEQIQRVTGPFVRTVPEPLLMPMNTPEAIADLHHTRMPGW